MTKLKVFFQNKLNILIVSIVAVVVIAVPLTITLMNKNKPVEVAQAPSSEPTSSISKPKVNVPEIKIDKPVSSEVSSETSSKEVTLKVDGEVSSKATSSKSQVKVEGNTPAKPAVSSKPTPPPVSSKPTTPVSSEPVIPPVNSDPNGPQHGDKMTDEYGTAYYHIGMGEWLDEESWNLTKNILNATEEGLRTNEYLPEGYKIWSDLQKEYNYWCKHEHLWLHERDLEHHNKMYPNSTVTSNK